MPFFSYFSMHISPLTLFGLILLLGLIGGEITRLVRFIPRISGYIAVGFLVGPSVFDIINPSLLVDIRLFVDIALGLILFDLGRQLDFTWLRHDPSIIYMSLAESSFTFILVFGTLSLLGISTTTASMAAVIAIISSPAVIILVTNDLSSEGPVTRRTLILTSLNNLIGLTLFTLLLPLAKVNTAANVSSFAFYIHKLGGALGLGLSIFLVALILGAVIGKRKESQFVLFVGLALLTISLAKVFHLSIMLSLFVFGVAARNFDYKHVLIEVDFAWSARLFFIIMFVVTGIQLNVQGFTTSTLVILSFVLMRFLAKTAGVWLFAKKSRLTKQQTAAISLALTPMSGFSIGMAMTLLEVNPILGQQLIMIITSAATVLHTFGPILTQFALLRTDEALTNN